MDDVFNPRLHGVIRRKHVGGRKGHRLIYLHPLRSHVVIPVYLSPDPKPPWSYDLVLWEEIGQEMFDDFMSGNYEAFSVIACDKILVG